jgi:hypothetical protein
MDRVVRRPDGREVLGVRLHRLEPRRGGVRRLGRRATSAVLQLPAVRGAHQDLWNSCDGGIQFRLGGAMEVLECYRHSDTTWS